LLVEKQKTAFRNRDVRFLTHLAAFRPRAGGADYICEVVSAERW
jgi:hypothetical protein